ncbi:MAG: hypothetical protein ACYSW3_02245 [Planctomycetota bacterium]|jgi:hypothetical protein
MAFHYLTNSKNQKVKDIEKAMWLVVGTDEAAEKLPIGERDRDMAGVAIRTFSDGKMHLIYNHPQTAVDRHFYTKADLTATYYENAGMVKNGKWMQANVIGGEIDLVQLTPTVEFPGGMRLRLLKHKMFNILLQGYTFKIYIAHLRDYIKDQSFITQWELIDNDDADAAMEIRMNNINRARAGRRVRAALREGDSPEGNKNWEQVERQLSEQGDMSHGDTDPDQEDAEEVVAVGSRTLLITNYHNKDEKVNMFDLPRGDYHLRMAKLDYPWPWDGANPLYIRQWTKFIEKQWKIDLG